MGALGRFKSQKSVEPYPGCAVLGGPSGVNLDLSNDDVSKAWKYGSPTLSCVLMSSDMDLATCTYSYSEWANPTPGCAIWQAPSLPHDSLEEVRKAYEQGSHAMSCVSMSTSFASLTQAFSEIPNPTPGCARWKVDGISHDSTSKEREAYDKVPHPKKCVEMSSTGTNVQSTTFSSTTATVTAPVTTDGL